MKPAWGDWYDELHDEVDATEELIEQWPEIAEARRSPNPPIVEFCCPKGHHLVAVKLEVDGDWRMSLEPVDASPAAQGAEPLPQPDRGVAANRVQLNCRSCNSRGTHRSARLLKLYAAAIRLDVSSIDMPT